MSAAGNALPFLTPRTVPSRPSTTSRSRGWAATLNLPDEAAMHAAQARIHAKADLQTVKYLVVAREIGESGNHHCQGYVVFTNAKTMQATKTWIGGNPHVEIARGTILTSIYLLLC